MITQRIGAVQNQPDNINFLNTHRFRLVLKRCPSLMYFVQECNLPAIQTGNATQPTPFTDIPVYSHKIEYSDLVVSFPVDEDLTNYKELANWMTGIAFPREFGQFADMVNEHLSMDDAVHEDISLMILDSAHQPMHVVNFRHAFPVSLSEIHFDTKADDTVIPIVTVTFKYAWWEFDEVNIDTPTTTPADTYNP
jgi:hypothetical protein